MLLWGTIQFAILQDGWYGTQDLRIDVEGPAELRGAVLSGSAVQGRGGLPALQRGDVDVVIRGTWETDKWDAAVHYQSTRPLSVAAKDHTLTQLSDLRQARLKALATAHGLTEEDIKPLVIRDELVSEVSQVLGSLLSMIVAILVSASMLIAGLFPAVDLVVGERERQTLETTLVAPVPRWVLLGGKVLACMLLILVAAAGNLGSAMLTATHLVTLMLDDLVTLQTPSALQILGLGPILGASAFLCATATLLSVLPARTFKEGQYAASVPLYIGLVPLFLGIVAVLSDGGDSALLSVPLANLVVVVFYGLSGQLTLSTAILPALENAALGAVFLWAGAWLAGREDFLIGGRLPRWLAWIRSKEST